MSEDDYILELAARFASSKEDGHSLIMQDIAKYIESIDDDEEAHVASRTIWNKNILPILLLEIKKDFTHFESTSWVGGVAVVRTVYEVLVDFVSLDRSDEDQLHRRFYPEFVENILCFCRQMQDNYNQSLIPNYRGILTSKELLKELKTVLEISEGFLNKFPDYIRHMVESPWFLQVFIADSEETCILTSDWLTELIKLSHGLVKDLGKVVIKGIGNVISTIMDELVYHLATTVNARLVDADLKCLLTILEADESLISILNHRYRGLKLILRKWSSSSGIISMGNVSKHFLLNLNKLIRVLDSGIIDLNQGQWAVIKIQAWWKSVALRAKLSKTNKAFSDFQINYRTRKTKERKAQEIQRIRKELEFQILMIRQKKFREKLEAEVLLMETLPAPIVLRHLENTRHKAATTIQAQWRGRQEKMKLFARKQLYKKTKSVITIQRHFRVWMSRKDFNEEREKLNADVNACLWRVPGLTGSRKAELIKEYNKWYVLHKYQFKGLSQEEHLKIHFEAMHLKRNHFRSLASTRRQDLCREATIARIESDCQLLLSAPSLLEACSMLENISENRSTKIDDFHCKIRPIANRATHLHHHQINRIKLPWWKQLLIEEPCDLDADNDFLTDAGDLNQYMILRNDLSETTANNYTCDNES